MLHCALVVGARIPAGDRAIPRGMMGPRPALLDRAARHRLERTGLRRRALVDMNDEAAQHQERREVMQHVAGGDRQPPERSRKPQRDSGDQEQYGAPDDRPEVDLLAGVEEPDVLGLERLRVRHVRLQMLQPSAIVARPGHGSEPVQNLQREGRHKSEAEPRMEEPRHRAAAEERHQPAREPGAVNSESGKEREDEKDRVAPMHDAAVRGMTKQFVFADHDHGLGSFGPSVT